MSSAFTREEEVQTMDADVDNRQGTTVDLAPCNFDGTFRNPCFWILIGILGTLGVQYIFTKTTKQ